LKVPFVKMHGAGNDFIVIDEYSGQLISERDKPAFVARYCRRHFGVGADGMIFVQKSPSADARFVFYNPDGSRAELCGNGIRCFAKYVYERGLVKKQNMNIETSAGMKNVEVFLSDGKVSSAKVDMGVPGIEFTAKEVEVSGLINRVTSISMGNPHAIVFVDDVDAVDVVSVGRRLRNLTELFPGGRTCISSRRLGIMNSASGRMSGAWKMRRLPAAQAYARLQLLRCWIIWQTAPGRWSSMHGAGNL